MTISEVGLHVHVPGELADLTYAMGEAEEGQPADLLLQRAARGCRRRRMRCRCAAAVSPYPLGQVVVADETPEHVREEFRDNPEESIGDFLVKVGDEWAYYSSPPDEPCYDDPEVSALQRRLTADLKEALSTLKPVD